MCDDLFELPNPMSINFPSVPEGGRRGACTLINDDCFKVDWRLPEISIT